MSVCAGACACVCVLACVHANVCARVCVFASMRACMHACVTCLPGHLQLQELVCLVWEGKVKAVHHKYQH